MKNRLKYLLILMLFFFALPAGFAQIGISVGAGVSDIAFNRFGQTPYLGYENNSLIHEKPLLSYQLGLFMPLSLGKNWQLQPELLFTAQGINYNKELLYDDIIYKISIKYLQVPVLLKYPLVQKPASKFGLYIGPYVAWKLRAIRTTEVEGIREKVNVPNVKTGDFGSIVGCSLDRKLATGDIFFNFRVGYSLINMMNPIEGHIPEFNKSPKEYARNVSFILSVGYYFNDILAIKHVL